MRSRDALKDGMARVWHAPLVLILVYLVTLLTALPMTIMLGSAIDAHLGNSLTSESVATGVNPVWWSEFAQAEPRLAGSFETTIIGFAAALDNLSRLLDPRDRPRPPLFWAGGFYLLLWLFLSGGILDRLARDRPTGSAEFFAACGVFFVRFLRLVPFIAAAYYVLFGLVHPFLFEDVYGALVRDVTVERTAFLWRLVLYVVFAKLLAASIVVFDYARARAVIEDRRSMIGALVASLRFIRRNVWGVASLFLLNGAIFIGVLVLYALVAPGARASGLGLWLGFAVSQLYLAARLWVRLVFFASEVSLFQGRLAHAGYIATRPAIATEPPIVEQIVTPSRS
jgi:hypothetical protein